MNFFSQFELFRTFAIGVVSSILLLLPVSGQQMSMKSYTSADGLANDSVNKIVADSRGFLWFGTEEGLSRFDGYSFKSYTQEDGLPHRNITDFLETKDGDYLIATPNGLVILDPQGKSYRWNIVDDKLEQYSNEPPLFRTYLPPDLSKLDGAKNVYSLAQDGNGTIYVSTTYGLYRLIKTPDDWQFERFEHPFWTNNTDQPFGSLFRDSRGDVWMSAGWFIYRILKSGEVERISEPGGNGFFEDRDGNIWVNSGGHDLGIRVFSILNDKPVLKELYTKKDGLSENIFTNAIAQTSDGRIFVSANGKLHEFLSDAKGNAPKFRRLENELYTSATDISGNLWFSTRGKGIVRNLPNSFYTLGEKEGLSKDWITSIFGNREGEIFLTTGINKLARVHDGKVETVQPLGFVSRDWVAISIDFQSPDGEFWLPSKKGLLRYPKVEALADLSHTPPKRIYTTADGLFSDLISAVFEDSRGDVWISATTKENSLLRWERSTDRIHRYTSEQGLPKDTSVTTLGEDADGNVWIGFYFGQLFRFKNGEFRDLTKENLIPRILVRGFFNDKKGRLWISSSSRGLFRVDDPDSEMPIFTNFSMSNGLSSNQTWCVTTDVFGRIYATTGRGINRIEPDTNRVKIFTQNDGLPGNNIERCYADTDGNLWFSSANSLIKFTPKADNVSAQPPIFIDAISINGKPRPVSELGEKEIRDLELGSDEQQIQIGFFAISFGAGETLRYQYKINDQDWSELNDRRTVDLNLSSGSYDFAVRAITASGVLSKYSATIAMTIARPVWQRWWFVMFVVLLAGALVTVFYRYRVANLQRVNAALTEARSAEERLRKSREDRLAELQRVRTRIATDLHDDIGSSLTQISLYSELARQKERETGKAGEPLDQITNISNELVDTMSDIVWAINPKKDHLPDLTQRMRRFAADTLSAKEIDMTFVAPDSEVNFPLGANIRREVFLIFKETLTNIAKHSDAKNARIELVVNKNTLELRFNDDGKGFAKIDLRSGDDWRKFRGGNGLINMDRRARELGGSYTIESQPGAGTTAILSIPLERSDNESE